MDQDLTQRIKARLEELPEDIRKAVQSADVDKKIQEIGAKNALHLDQIGNLGDEVYMVMLGFTDPAEFAENLAKELNVPKEKAEAIAKDIGTALFIPIRESMQQFMEERALHEAILEEGKAHAVQTPPATPVVITKPSVPKPVEAHPADLMLTQKTVTVAPTQPTTNNQRPTTNAQPTTDDKQPTTNNSQPATNTPPKPQPYKSDPYREPTT